MAKRKINRRQLQRASPRLALLDIIEVGIVIGLLVALVAAFYWLRNPASLPIRHVSVEGDLHHVTEAEIGVLSSRPGFAGFFYTDLRGIETTLEQLPWVKSVSVRRQWPDRLIVNLHEQMPVARWGSDALLNSAGEIFEPKDVSEFADLPVVFGPLDQSQMLVQRFHDINSKLESAGLNLRALAQDDRHAWHLLLGNGIPVALGRDNPDARIQRLVSSFSQIVTTRSAQIASIDLRYTNGFAVSWRDTEFSNHTEETK